MMWLYQLVIPVEPQTETKRNAVDLTADRLRDDILTGRLVPGVALPGERDLSERLGVSRLTLRSALARLGAEGLVQSVHGSGTRVLDFRQTGSVDLIGYLAAKAHEGDTVPVDMMRDLLELRGLVGSEVAGLAAERATDEELEALRAHVRRMRGLVDDPDAFMHADIEFARMLVRTTRNLAIELMANTVTRVVERHPGLRPGFLANREQVVAGYDVVLDLVGSRDADRARSGVRKLMALVDPETLKRLQNGRTA
jgi:GntR family transcriptional regulator, transcriptional repressor for pyruvate dehydrogenase complex